jgi:soluble lytic murein transglycosylase-like protein
MASVAILSVIVPLSVIPAIADQKTEDQFTSKVVLNKNANIVEIASKHSTIVPGESRVQSEARVAAEAAKAAQVASSSRTVIAREKRVYNDPANFDGIYQSAGAAYGIDWRILKAVHYVETGASGSTSKRNPSGATGPMQFIPSTWRAYGVDGNGDDVKDITNVEDAIYAAANYLSASGGSMNGYKTALWSYNPSTRYFAKVMDVARSLGF